MRRHLLILTFLIGLAACFFGRLEWLYEPHTGLISAAHAEEDEDGDDEDSGDDDSDDDDSGDDDAGDDDSGDDDSGDDDSGDDDSGDDDSEDDDSDDGDDDDRDEDDGDGAEDDLENGQNSDPLETPQTPRGTSDREEDRFVDDEIMLLTDPGWSATERAALAAAGYDVLSQTPLAGIGAVVVRLSLPAGLTPRQALDRARTLAPTAIFDLNHVYRPSGEACSPSDCWGQEMVGLAEPALACPDLGSIAIIDTPIVADHPALAKADVTARNFIPAGSSETGAEHGTAIAALLVGESVPGASPLVPGARLLAAGALAEQDGETRADAITVLQALDWAVSEGARVIGLSIEGDPNSALAFGIRASAQHASLIAAAGNSGARGAPAYPAAYTDVIAVSAIDRRLRPYRQGTRGDYVEIAAPGVDIVSRTHGGEPHGWTGSSFAVPFVAAAMLRSQAVTPEARRAARARLGETAKDLGPPGRDRIFGHGLVQPWGQPCG